MNYFFAILSFICLISVNIVHGAGEGSSTPGAEAAPNSTSENSILNDNVSGRVDYIVGEFGVDPSLANFTKKNY